MASDVRFSEEELDIANDLVNRDLDNIAYHILAAEFAKRDLGLRPGYESFYEEFPEAVELWLEKQTQIANCKPPYLREFETNGFSNLRFKMFYRPADEENDHR